MKSLCAVLLALLCGCSLAQTRVEQAAAEDAATTVIGLAVGAAEANPVGLLAMPLKLVAMQQAEALPDGERQYAQHALSSMWHGAAVNNACVIAAVATGGAFAPACLIAGLAAGLYRWESSSDERQFWAICINARQSNPILVCNFTK